MTEQPFGPTLYRYALVNRDTGEVHAYAKTAVEANELTHKYKDADVLLFGEAFPLSDLPARLRHDTPVHVRYLIPHLTPADRARVDGYPAPKRAFRDAVRVCYPPGTRVEVCTLQGEVVQTVEVR